MTAWRDLTYRLVCPEHRTLLTMPDEMRESRLPWPDGEVACAGGCRFPVRSGLARFVARTHYADAFGLQWRHYRRTQLDSNTGVPISRIRLERCLGAPLSALEGKAVLECGAGAGRFTELLADAAGSLVALDLSDAVDANLANCAVRKAHLLVQADLNHAPVAPASFDVVVCLGVLQHTPSPEGSIASLAAFLKPGGLLVLDHYTYRTGLAVVGQYASARALLRQVLKRVGPRAGLRATIALSALCDPIRKHTSRVPALDLLASAFLPTVSYYGKFPELADDTIREWNALDTHDGLTDWYKHRRSTRQVERTLRALGLRVLRCEQGGNGVEALAELPAGASGPTTRVAGARDATHDGIA